MLKMKFAVVKLYKFAEHFLPHKCVMIFWENVDGIFYENFEQESNENDTLKIEALWYGTYPNVALLVISLFSNHRQIDFEVG